MLQQHRGSWIQRLLARARGGPRRAPGARVHGGPATQPEGVRDLVRPSQISRSRTRASKGQRRARRRVAARGGGSPALPLSGAPGHQHDHKLVHYVEGAHAHVTEGSGGRSCLVGGRHRKGAARLLRRARGGAKMLRTKGYRAGVITHCSKERQVSSKVKGMRWRWSLATATGRAAPRCGRGRGSYRPRGREPAAT
jgi:hypothetical protein